MSSCAAPRSGSTSLPDPLAVLGLGEREVDDDVEAAQERVVDVLAEVGREDDGAVVALHLLEQVGDLDVRVAVVGVAHLGALAEERVGLVEEEDRVRALGGAEDAVEVLLGLADVLARRRSRDRPGRGRGRGRAASTWPAIVLPVPDSPAKSTLIPCVRATVFS